VVLTLVVNLSLFGACSWRSYGKATATHADLLVAMARKGADLVASGRLTAESLPELTYPLERADAFLRAAAARSTDHPPPSLRALAEPLATVERAGEGVRAALHAEGRL